MAKYEYDQHPFGGSSCCTGEDTISVAAQVATTHPGMIRHPEISRPPAVAALVTPRRLNLVRYHGVLAPNATKTWITSKADTSSFQRNRHSSSGSDTSPFSFIKSMNRSKSTGISVSEKLQSTGVSTSLRLILSRFTPHSKMLCA